MELCKEYDFLLIVFNALTKLTFTEHKRNKENTKEGP
jgi:hypothetical protein